MARRRQLTEAGDYAVANGSFVEDPTQTANVLRLLRTQRGSVPFAPKMGSRLHRIGKIAPETPRVAEQETLEALQPLIQDGRIWDVSTTATEAPGGLVVTVDFTDASGERSVRQSLRRQ